MDERIRYWTRQHTKVAGLYAVCDLRVAKTLVDTAVDRLLTEFPRAARLGTADVHVNVDSEHPVVLRRDNKTKPGKYADFRKKRISKGSELALALASGPNEMTSSVWFGRVAETYPYGHGKATIVKLESSHAGDPLPGEVLDPRTGERRKDILQNCLKLPITIF